MLDKLHPLWIVFGAISFGGLVATLAGLGILGYGAARNISRGKMATDIFALAVGKPDYVLIATHLVIFGILALVIGVGFRLGLEAIAP